MNSNEFSDLALITSLYRAFLGREPEPAAVANFGRGLASGILDARALVAELANCDEYRQRQSANSLWVPPGHFYSPVVNIDELRADAERVFDRSRTPAEIDLNEEFQISMVPGIRLIASQLPFTAQQQDNFFYYFDNIFYSYGDGIVLASMIRHFKPKKIVEFGSGFSSCLMMDINKLYFDGKIECTFIDPYPEALLSILRSSPGSIRILQSRAQDIDFNLVRSLSSNDILFIDSTHVSKAGSDVNFHLFDTLPALKPGVLIHFHDVAYPFEYPEDWFFVENRSWNEIYLLRSFLMHNNKYRIQFFNDFMARVHPDLTATIPRFDLNSGGAIWLRKL
jgi:hypothetical protein